MEPILSNNLPSNLSGLPKKKNSKIYILVLAVILVLIAVSAVFYKQVIWPKKEIANLPPAPQYTKTDLPTDKLPEVFPKDLIQEKDPIILESYQADIEATKSESSKTQYTVKYITKNSIDENNELYRKYFTDNKWAILNRNKTENYFTLRVAKDIDSVIVTQSIDNTGSLSIVSMTLIRIILNSSVNDVKK